MWNVRLHNRDFNSSTAKQNRKKKKKKKTSVKLICFRFICERTSLGEQKKKKIRRLMFHGWGLRNLRTFATEKSTYTNTLTVIWYALAKCREFPAATNCSPATVYQHTAAHCNDKRPSAPPAWVHFTFAFSARRDASTFAADFACTFFCTKELFTREKHKENQWQNNPSFGHLNALALDSDICFPPCSVGLPKYRGQRPQKLIANYLLSGQPFFFSKDNFCPGRSLNFHFSNFLSANKCEKWTHSCALCQSF